MVATNTPKRQTQILSPRAADSIVNLASPTSGSQVSIKQRPRAPTYGSEIIDDGESEGFESSSDDFGQPDDNDQGLCCDRPTYAHLIDEEKEEPAPLAKSGINLQPDMIHGWKPKTNAILFGAPIPLHYNFENQEMPTDPLTH